MQNTFFCCSDSDTGQRYAGSRFDYEKYVREYRRRNPEKVLRWRLNQAVNLLRRNGYTVLPPDTAQGEGGEQR